MKNFVESTYSYFPDDDEAELGDDSSSGGG